MKIASISARGANAASITSQEGQPLAILRRLEAAVWIFDVDHSRIAFANDAACALWQAETEEELCSRDLASDMTPVVAKRLKQYQIDFLETDATFTELWTLYPNGEPENVMVVYRGFRLDDGRMAMQCEAVASFKDQPENLRSTEALLYTDVMITLFSAGGPPLYLNPAARNTFPSPLNDLVQLFVEPDDLEEARAQIDALGEFRRVTKLQTVLGNRWFDLSVKGCSDAVTGQPALLLTAIDVSELKEARDTARHLADRDQLTGLHNRSYLQRHLTQMEKTGLPAGSFVIYFDVDRFKLINDRYGHEAGDTVLKQIALRTRATMRTEDMVARLGGDEFVIVVDGLRDAAALRSQISRLRAAISKPIIHNKTRIETTISVGVAAFSRETSGFSDVLRQADIALYASKEGGRDSVTFFDNAMGAAALARDRLEVELKQAVVAQDFELHYQPRLDIKTGKIVSAEGLVRWRHPDGSLVMPDTFIPICEETGLIDELGRIVLRLGCHQAIAWHKAGLEIDVSLNVSPRQFADERFLATLAGLANLPGFPKGRVELEITENVLIGDPETIADKLRAITDIGYRIAIDDFGTGYSNLSYISQFPLTCLKIDRSFIAQLPGSGPIVQLILTLGKEIGAVVVSEGVETQAQLDWLAENKCEEAQGYLITRPLIVPEFEAFVANFGSKP